MLTTLSLKNLVQWYKNVDNVQKCLKTICFKLLTRLNMRVENQVDLGEQVIKELETEREQIRRRLGKISKQYRKKVGKTLM